MLDHLLELSHLDDSNKWSNIGFGEEVTEVALIEVKFTFLIWSSGILTWSMVSASVHLCQFPVDVGRILSYPSEVSVLTRGQMYHWQKSPEKHVHILTVRHAITPEHYL